MSLTVVGLLFFALSASAASPDSIIDRAHHEHWDEDIQWLRLAKYHRGLFGAFYSQADSDKFFLSKDGRTNPSGELDVTIRELLSGTLKIKSRDGQFEDPVGCVFSARRLWLERKMGQKLPAIACDRYDRFREILGAQSLTYVFSSYFLNNPASSFGHTFLRINKAPSARDGERYELTDYGFSYAAVKFTQNPFVYSILGVSGLMPGVFEVNPYYYKVREYNDFESRDLWEYDIHFTPDEVAFTVAIIWELVDVNFNYHYFSQNCSYRILAILETARPTLHLIDELKTQVMPADTVQVVYRTEGLVSKIHYRPSVRSIFESRVGQLPDALRSRIQKFASDENVERLVESLSPEDQKRVLDVAIDYLDYRYPAEILSQTGKYALKKIVLGRRAEVGGLSEPVPILVPWDEAPHDAEGSRRLGVGYRQWQNDGQGLLLSYKFALHDLLDGKFGYPSNAQVTFGDLALSVQKSVAIERFTLFEVVSVSPLTDFSFKPTWRVRVSHDRGYENDCAGLCNWTELSGGAGLTKSFGSLDVSLLARVSGETSSSFVNQKFRIGGGPAASLRIGSQRASLLGEAYYRFDYRVGEMHDNFLGAQFTPVKEVGIRAGIREMNHLSIFDTQAFFYY